MKNLYLSEIINIIDGTILSKTERDPLIKHVISRKSDPIQNSTLIFFPHKSKLKNLELQSCVIVTQKLKLFMDLSKSFTIVAVENSREAFEKFIKFYRNLFQIPVVGITGTCGKTTTKDMVSSILEKDMNIVKTIRSQNAPYKNLHYLMKINEQTDAVVIEAGVGAPGGIESFGRFFHPAIGVITNIDVDHMRGFKTQQAYINEKAMMLKVISKNKGTIILNRDDVNIQNLDLGHFEGRIIYYGLDTDTHFKASDIDYDEQGMKFSVHHGGQVFPCKINCFGTHNVYNVLAALAVCTTLGIELNDAIQRLESFQPLERHLQILKGINNCKLIDDTWNTNSKSTEAALQTLVKISNGRKTIAVLGDIAELGDASESEHKKIGTFIYKYNINKLVTIGKESKFIAQKAMELGMNKSDIVMLEHQEDLINVLKKITDVNSIVLIKTSMRNSFNDIVKKLIIE